MLITAGCNSKPTTTSNGYNYPDSIPIDSTTLWQGTSGGDMVAATYFVMDTFASVYTVSGGQLHFDTVLRMTDSVTVTKDVFEEYLQDGFYPVSFDGRHGYMRGTSLGAGLVSDFDNDGKQDLIIYGYTHYVKDTLDELTLNPFSVRFVSATGAISSVHDTAASNMKMVEVQKVLLSKKVHVYELSAGYPACGFPQFHFIIACGNGTSEIIHRSVTAVDGAYGDFCDFHYPLDSTRHTDTIYISHRMMKPLTDESDSLTYTTLDSTVLYLHEGKWTRRNFKMDPESN
jgi:hypothetical protein